jgi:hypothetical protein
LSFYEKQLELKTDELISKTIKLNEANRGLAAASQKLESKTNRTISVELDFKVLVSLKEFGEVGAIVIYNHTCYLSEITF